MFLAMPLPVVEMAHGTPYAVSIQDPWLSDHHETHPESKPPATSSPRRLHGALELRTMKDADAIIANLLAVGRRSPSPAIP
jgi:hypothetical protein